MALREANRRAYAKRTGKPVPPKKDVFMDAIKAKQAQAAAERKLLNDTIDAVMQDAQTVESAEQAQAIDPIAYAYEVLRRKLRYEAEHKDAPQAIDDLIEMVVIQAQKIAELSEQSLTAEEIHNKHATQKLLEEKPLSEWSIVEIDRGLFWKNSRIKGDVYIYDALILRAMDFEEKIAEQEKEIERLKAIESELESVKRMSSGVAG